MNKKIQLEKVQRALEKIGKTLFQQRTIILKKEIPAFIKDLNQLTNVNFTNEIIYNMENGKEVSIIYWLHIWLYFQNLDKIIQAYDAKEMMFLAQQEFVENIEKEILANYNKNK